MPRPSQERLQKAAGEAAGESKQEAGAALTPPAIGRRSTAAPGQSWGVGVGWEKRLTGCFLFHTSSFSPRTQHSRGLPEIPTWPSRWQQLLCSLLRVDTCSGDTKQVKHASLSLSQSAGREGGPKGSQTL